MKNSIKYFNLWCCIKDKTLHGATPLRIIFDKVDWYIRKYDKTKYLALFYSEKYNGIFSRVRYTISLKSNISTIYSRNTKIKINSDEDLPTEKTITTLNVIILIKSFNENHDCY